MEYEIDPARTDPELTTGIFVRAKNEDGKWLSVDISWLKKDHLLHWLRSRDGNNRWAEDVVGILLGHGHLHPPK